MMKKLIWGVGYVAIFALAFFGGISINTFTAPSLAGFGTVEWNDSIGRIETDIPYADGRLNRFDLYLPTDRERATKLVLYIHAGGFTGGDKSDDANMAKFFASKGYVAATINYSLRSNADTASVTDMSSEIKEGAAAIVDAARARGYDLDGMVIAGGSAGGTLAMIYAYRDAAAAPVPVDAVINMVGPASFEPAAWFGFDGYASDERATAGAAFVSIITGDTITPAMMRSGAYEPLLKKVSPIMLVTSGAPPTLLAYGELDKIAPYAASNDLPHVLQQHGVPYDALIFPNSGHGLNRDRAMSQELGEKINSYLSRYAPLN